MYRIGEKVYDKCLGKTVIITPELKAAIENISFSLAETRWVKDEQIEDANVVEEKEVEEDTIKMTLEEAKEAYKSKHGKQVSNKYKNNLEWIVGKL